ATRAGRETGVGRPWSRPPRPPRQLWGSWPRSRARIGGARPGAVHWEAVRRAAPRLDLAPKGDRSMTPDSRPLVVLAGPIHPDGHAQLEREARVVVSDETEEGVIRGAAEAQGILIRARPRLTQRLRAACPRLAAVGRAGAAP